VQAVAVHARRPNLPRALANPGKEMALVLLEHVNLAVPERALARRFYVDGLGCAPNPLGSNDRQLHVNLGLWCVVSRLLLAAWPSLTLCFLSQPVSPSDGAVRVGA
jgi:hypothetical protein